MIKLSKILVMILISIMLISVFSPIVRAKSTQSTQSWITDITTMEGAGSTAELGQNKATAKVSSTMGRLVSIIRIISVGIAIIMLMAVAMKYLMAAPSDKADIKKHAVVYVVGAVVLFGVSGILGIIADFADMI